jgi:DNA-binding transcriptional ArsR family regulator
VAEKRSFVPNWGTKRRKTAKRFVSASMVEIERDEGLAPSPVDALFTATQRRVLACLFGEPTHAFHMRELLARTGAGHGAVQREVARLVAAGLVRATRDGNRRLLQADPNSPIHAELTALLRKTVGLAEPLRAAFRLAQPYLHACFAFEEERNPWYPEQRDLGVVAVLSAEPSPLAGLDFGRAQAEQLLGRGVWVTAANLRRLREDPYLRAVLRRPRVWVFGSEERLQVV